MSSSQVFKKIKRFIRRYNPYELLDCIQDLLFHPDATGIERMQKIEYWNLLLLFKWVIQFGNFENTQSENQVTEEAFATLLNDMKNLSSKVFSMRTDQDRFLYFRALCFQQFWVNRSELVYFGIARQYALFGNLEPEHRFQQWFASTYGLRIDEFIELSLAVYSHFKHTEVRLVNESNFAPLEHAYSVRTIRRFLDTLSISICKSREWLQSLEVGSHRDFRSEFHEQSPFFRYPFLRSPDGYICISPHLLDRSLSSLVYDLLREAFSISFPSKFGVMFERYVHRALETVSGVLITEDQLQRYLGFPERQKYVDFLLVEKGNNIFVETKAKALPPKAMVARGAMTFKNAAESPILDGMNQAYSLASTLSSQLSVGNKSLGSKQSYLLIITYRDMFAGNGLSFRNFIAPEEVAKTIDKYSGKEWIPLENIFFLSIDEFDLLLGSIKKSAISMSDVLEYAKRSGPSTLSRLFAFRDTILEACGPSGVGPPEYYFCEVDKLFEKVIKGFQS